MEHLKRDILRTAPVMAGYPVLGLRQRGSSLLSILGGTAIYMLLIRLI